MLISPHTMYLSEIIVNRSRTFNAKFSNGYVNSCAGI